MGMTSPINPAKVYLESGGVSQWQSDTRSNIFDNYNFRTLCQQTVIFILRTNDRKYFASVQ